MPLADIDARLRILTDFGATLLVEAAAGTGKTALLAGRLTMLLAHGTEPGLVAAITFTDLAASELLARVHRYVEELIGGRVPEPLRLALANGLDADQQRALLAAKGRLDELTITTIHAFCQKIISSYAVEADVDPGARILDAVQAAAAFDSIFEQWLKRRLNGPELPGDVIVTLSRGDPRRIVDTLQELARFRLRYRGARTVPAELVGRPDTDLVSAVADFRRWLSSQPSEPKTMGLVAELQTLANFYADTLDPVPDFATLWRLAHPPHLRCMRWRSFDLLTPRWKSAWDEVAGRQLGAQLNDEATARFERVNHCYRTLLGQLATAVVAQLSAELDELLDDYAAFKRAAAVLDFDDLLEKARRLVRDHDEVRRALGKRYRYIFIDEFQDTDPIQSEILFRIAAQEPAERWQDCMIRAGSLFMVGDPKQAIYRFRGADIGSYAQARAAIEREWPDNIVQVTANFRSRPEILKHVNRCFAKPLSRDEQPGYVPLTPTLDGPDHDLPCVARITVDVPPNSRSDAIRDAEAEAVADVCTRLIGNVRVRDGNGAIVPITAGGIALLAPTGADLWRYERALEQRGLSIASQAGKSFFRRQEVQDLLVLASVLADSRDTLSFGALMRGPLIGVSEEELLDITSSFPLNPDRPDAQPRFSVLTEPGQVSHQLARRKLVILQDLRRKVRATTPALLLAEAAERLAIRPILAAREGDRGARAAANVEAFLERARPYGVRGLKKFVRDLVREWLDGAPHNEGRVDAEGDAIQIITMHSAKGLEWPVVIPINTGTLLRSREPFVYRASDETLHWIIGDVVPPNMLPALESEADSLARERERLWYVACTRARELLIVPELPSAEQRSWARIVDLGLRELPQLNLSRLMPIPRAAENEPSNDQTPEVFESERVAIAAATKPLQWLRPSDQDPDRAARRDISPVELSDPPETDLPVGAGRLRGLLLHKVIEEVLTGELPEDVSSFAARARVLMTELVIDAESGAEVPDPEEIAATAFRTLELPEIAAIRPCLVPEWPIYAMLANQLEPTALAGRIDAIALEHGRPSIVLDWKSDVAPGEEDIREHTRQITDYLKATGAPRGALVYMTTGSVRWVSGP